MPVRSNTLPKNQSPGCLDEKPLRTVHQRPPKNIAPSKMPVTRASARLKASFIVILLSVSHFLLFLGDPMPRIETTDCESGNQQSQRPGMFARVVFVQPNTERRAE